MVGISGLHKDFIASHIRSQLTTLNGVLECIESSGLSNEKENGYVDESLKRVEKNIRRLRRIYVNS